MKRKGKSRKISSLIHRFRRLRVLLETIGGFWCWGTICSPLRTEPKKSRAKTQSSQRKTMKRYLHETQYLCRSKKLNSHLFFGNPLYHWLSGHCKKFRNYSGSGVQGSTFRVKDKDGIEDPKSSSKMLISSSNCQFGSKSWIRPYKADTFFVSTHLKCSP